MSHRHSNRVKAEGIEEIASIAVVRDGVFASSQAVGIVFESEKRVASSTIDLIRLILNCTRCTSEFAITDEFITRFTRGGTIILEGTRCTSRTRAVGSVITFAVRDWLSTKFSIVHSDFSSSAISTREVSRRCVVEITFLATNDSIVPASNTQLIVACADSVTSITGVTLSEVISLLRRTEIWRVDARCIIMSRDQVSRTVIAGADG